MRRYFNVELASEQFFWLDGSGLDAEPEPETDCEWSDDEVTDSSVISEEESEEQEPQTPPRCATRRSAKRKRRWGTDCSRTPRVQTAEPGLRSKPWRTEQDWDTGPTESKFQPLRIPGLQVHTLYPLTAKDLFSLYFSADTVKTICTHTNKNAAINKERGKKYKWIDIEPEDLYKFFGLLFFTTLVQLPNLQDYWKQNHVLSVSIPSKVMTRERFRTILWNIHLSDPEADVVNDSKKGTPSYDKLFKVRPLYDDILNACQAYFHPRRELAVDERMVATKTKTCKSQYMTDRPTQRGIKFFVLTESCSGYTVNFQIYTGKAATVSENGLAYDVVMNLISPSSLGTGYHLYMNIFYTSPKLFLDLASMKFGACGTYREGGKECPGDGKNALTKKSRRGSFRWIREGPLLFVKWMDTHEVSVCSTIHSAYSGETVTRKMKDRDGCLTERDIPYPTPISAYNKYMSGVDLSDQLIQYYSTLRKSACWYKTILLHFLDIASTNAFILHREISSIKKVQPMTHKDFMVELLCQLCGVDNSGVPQSRKTSHVPVPIASTIDPSQKATKGRLKCKHCLENNKRSDTPWKCEACDVALCLVVDRNCFREWHT
ncbi:piggyBac transposable element-derived protein 3-like [Sphaeramia orbicularis]|uniref:piggyBac transposable element-derived protein 3-like n=1 Tax=Sphaeramia orbicularis TaxID=375764 RepID=UPI00117E7716|nr:piggyBac transposable element-derived protein 3-like [Sphaeramia orbicularis]